MTDDAADDDDERMKSLRAVWLSMPDEDPPERGLADLMAAARVKANEMAAKAEPAAPSMWQRFLELMRRPPVLALATVMVLIGGAALVGRRGDQMESSPTVAPTQAVPESTTTSAPAPAKERVDNAAAPAAEPAAPAQGSAMAMPAAESTPPAGGEGAKESTATGVVGGAAVEQKAAENKQATAPKREALHGASATWPIEKKSAPARRTPLADTADRTESFDAELATDAAPVKTRGGAPAPQEESQATSAAAATSTKSDASSTGVAELHRAARLAASRKDCTGVRQLTQKIAALDAAYYKANVVRDPALAVCTNSN